MALASGIQPNVADQNNELATVTALGNVPAHNPIDMTLYSAMQASLLGFLRKGIAIRQENQRIAPAGNGAAIAGVGDGGYGADDGVELDAKSCAGRERHGCCEG